MISIETIVRRSEQGVLRPFLCLGDDGRRYFVKGRGAGRASLVSEFMAGSLGRRLGLPIPPFAIVDVPKSLIRDSAVDEARELGSGPCFASEQVSFAQEIGSSHLSQITDELKQDVLLFDWWVHNQDRAFSGSDGNPNLLWDTARNTLAVIDHNLAFDPFFNPRDFWSTHIFREQRTALTGAIREAAKLRLQSAFSHFESIVRAIPEEWHYEDPFETLKSDFDFATAESILRCFRKDEFWLTFDL